MKRLMIVAMVLGVALGTGWTAFGEGKGMCDGKTYTGMLTSSKDGKTYDESIIFEKGMMRSTACEAMGFKAGEYTCTKEGKAMMVKGSLKDEKGNMSMIEVTIKGQEMTGTLTAKAADGTVQDTMALKASMAKKGEQPAAMEHPAKTEHPK